MAPLRLSLEGGLSQALVDRLHAHVLAAGLGVEMSPTLRPVVALVLEEVCTNIMEHSGATWLEVGISLREGWVCARVTDNGKPFDLGQATRERNFLDLSEVGERRLGLYMVQHLANKVHYGLDPDGHNQVEFEFDTVAQAEDA